MILRRLTRPVDRHMGLVYGEDPRPVQHHSGPHAGHTVVTVHSVGAEGRLMADGWERVPAAPPALQRIPGRPAVVVLPADPANPLDPSTGPGEGGDVTGSYTGPVSGANLHPSPVFDGPLDALKGDDAPAPDKRPRRG